MGSVATEAALGGVLQDVLEAFGDVLAVGSAAGHVAVGHEGQARKRGDRDGAAELAFAEGAVGELPPSKCGEPACDGAIELGRDLVGR